MQDAESTTERAFPPGVYTGPTDSTVFISINRNRGFDQNLPRLALVDLCYAADLVPLHWRTTPLGHVYRTFSLRGMARRISESLGARVLGIHQTENTNTWPINGDRLDLRAENTVSAVDGRRPSVARDYTGIGRTFAETPSFKAAYAQRVKDSEALSRAYPMVANTAKLTPQQVQAMLREIAENTGGTLWKDRTLAFVQDYLEGECNVRLSASQALNILRGRAQHQPGFEKEYAKIAELFPRRSARRVKRIQEHATAWQNFSP